MRALAPLLLVVALTSTVLAVSPASRACAQAGTDDQEARMRFDLGQRYYEQGRFAEAAVEFERAYVASQRDALLYNMFVAHRDAGNDVAAADALRRYLATRTPAGDERSNLESRLATLERRIASGETGTASGGGSPLPLIGGIVAGVGGVMLIASIGTGVVALDQTSQLEARCPGGGCPSGEAGLIDSTHTLGIATDVLWVAGATLAAGGVALLIVGLISGGDGESASADVTPIIGCDGQGCVLGVGGVL